MPNNDEKKVLLKVTDLKQWFPLKKTKLFQKEQEYVRANDGITLNIYEGETVGLVGESGCGKSTFGRTLLQIYKQTEGKTMYYGRTLTDMAPLYVDETIKNISSTIRSPCLIFPRMMSSLNTSAICCQRVFLCIDAFLV